MAKKTEFEEIAETVRGLLESIRELRESHKELRESQAETDLQIKELRESQAETDRQIKQTDLQLKQTDLQLKQTDLQLKKTDLQLKKTDRRFNTQWGRLVESLVEGNIVRKFRERGHKVTRTLQRVKGDFEGKSYEFDIVATDGDEIIVVEVKTNLGIGDIKHFIKKMENYKRMFPEHSGKKVLAAVAYIMTDSNSDTYSQKRGLYTVRATGDSSAIVNEAGFVPREF